MFVTSSDMPIPESPRDVPLFKTLTPEECEAILSRNNVGRIAFTLHDRVNIVPIHYVYVNDWVYGRTSAAGKLRDILRNRRIVFEVDEHRELFEWHSVIVRGPLYLIQPDSTQRTRSIYRTGVSVIRRLLPDAFTAADSVPFRDQLFRIRAVEVSGRASFPIGGSRLFQKNADVVTETARPDIDRELLEQVQIAIAGLNIPNATSVQVDVFDGVVALSGTVETVRDRSAIESAVLQVPAVTALVQEIETVVPNRQELSPAELARAALRQLNMPPSFVGSGIKVVIEHGWLRLEGAVTSLRASDDVIRRLRQMRNSRGVIDRLEVVASSTALAVAD